MYSTRMVPLVLDWFACHARDLPWRRTRDPYAIWVSEIMLQQTQVKAVLPYWRRWMEALPTVVALAKASPERIHKLWEGLGYYTRVRNMHEAAQQIVQKHRGKFPEDFDEVLALPGIGRYTAGAICSIAFNQPKPILDGNVMRVLTRGFGIDGDPREKRANARLWRLSEQLVEHVSVAYASEPNSRRKLPGSGNEHSASSIQHPVSRFNQAVMELGALICTARQPRCEVCPLRRLCVAFKNGSVHRLPRLKPRPRPTNRRFIAFVAQKRKRFLVRQRPAGVVNAHLWEFPNLEVVNGTVDLGQAAHQEIGARAGKLEPFFSLKHSITRYRITLDVFYMHALGDSVKSARCRWADRATLARLPFSSAHRQIAARLIAQR